MLPGPPRGGEAHLEQLAYGPHRRMITLPVAATTTIPKAGVLPIALYRGDTWHLEITAWLDAAMTQPADLTGAEARAEIRDKPNGSLICTIACAISLPNTIRMTLPPSETTKAPRAGVWDLQLRWPNGDVQTIAAGAVCTTDDVTR